MRRSSPCRQRVSGRAFSEQEHKVRKALMFKEWHRCCYDLRAGYLRVVGAKEKVQYEGRSGGRQETKARLVVLKLWDFFS